MLDQTTGSDVSSRALDHMVLESRVVDGSVVVRIGDPTSSSSTTIALPISAVPAPDATGLRVEGATLIDLDAAGNEAWRQDNVAGRLVGRTPDRIVELGPDNQLRGINIDGTLEWNSRLDHRLFAVDAQSVDGMAYAVGPSYDPDLPVGPAVTAAIDATTGALLWRSPVPPQDPAVLPFGGGTEMHLAIVGDAVVVATDATASAATGSAQVTALDRITGTVRWTAHLDHPSVVALDATDEGVLAVATDRQLFCD